MSQSPATSTHLGDLPLFAHHWQDEADAAFLYRWVHIGDLVVVMPAPVRAAA